jgi:hypothetical protein
MMMDTPYVISRSRQSGNKTQNSDPRNKTDTQKRVDDAAVRANLRSNPNFFRHQSDLAQDPSFVSHPEAPDSSELLSNTNGDSTFFENQKKNPDGSLQQQGSSTNGTNFSFLRDSISPVDPTGDTTFGINRPDGQFQTGSGKQQRDTRSNEEASRSQSTYVVNHLEDSREGGEEEEEDSEMRTPPTFKHHFRSGEVKSGDWTMGGQNPRKKKRDQQDILDYEQKLQQESKQEYERKIKEMDDELIHKRMEAAKLQADFESKVQEMGNLQKRIADDQQTCVNLTERKKEILAQTLEEPPKPLTHSTPFIVNADLRLSGDSGKKKKVRIQIDPLIKETDHQQQKIAVIGSDGEREEQRALEIPGSSTCSMGTQSTVFKHDSENGALWKLNRELESANQENLDNLKEERERGAKALEKVRVENQETIQGLLRDNEIQRDELQRQYARNDAETVNKEKLNDKMWDAIRDLQNAQPATATTPVEVVAVTADTTFDPLITPSRISKVSKKGGVSYSLMARRKEEAMLSGKVTVLGETVLGSPNTSSSTSSTDSQEPVDENTSLRERIRELEGRPSTGGANKSRGTGGKYSKPFKFVGDEGDVITLWMKLFENWCRNANIDFDGTEMIGAMLGCVGPNVMTAYQAMSAAEQTSWSKVKAKLEDNWSPIRAKDYARKSFDKRVQGVNESFRQFMDCLAELGNKGWGVLCTDEKVNTQFFNGVRDKSVRKQMNNAFQFDPLESLDRPTMVYIAEGALKVVLERAAIDLDSSKDSSKEMRKVVGTTAVGNSLPAAIANRNREEQQRAMKGKYPERQEWKDKALCYGCGETGHIIRECPNAFLTKSPHHVNVMCELVGLETFERLCDEAGVPMNNTDNNLTLRVINQMMNVECFTCGQKGHFSTQCKAENADPREGRRARENVAARREMGMMRPGQGARIAQADDKQQLTSMQKQLETQGEMIKILGAQLQIQGNPVAYQNQNYQQMVPGQIRMYPRGVAPAAGRARNNNNFGGQMRPQNPGGQAQPFMMAQHVNRGRGQGPAQMQNPGQVPVQGQNLAQGQNQYPAQNQPAIQQAKMIRAGEEGQIMGEGLENGMTPDGIIVTDQHQLLQDQEELVQQEMYQPMMFVAVEPTMVDNHHESQDNKQGN